MYPLVALRARAREWRVRAPRRGRARRRALLDEGLEADARRVVAIAEPLLVGLAGTADFAPRAAALAETRRRAGVRLLAWPSNDEGATVALGNDRSFPGYRGSDKFYCGRRMAIPGSDGQCGPSAGPQCASCERLQRSFAKLPAYQKNDDGCAVALGNRGSFYCGQLASIPGGNGRCGPLAGPQCAACAHFQLRYPAAAEENWCAAEAKANDTVWTQHARRSAAFGEGRARGARYSISRVAPAGGEPHGALAACVERQN